MELTKQDTQIAKGMAILGMVMLHLFCRLGDLPYTPLIWCGGTPLIYYLGLFGDLCVPVYCFCSGYAHYLMADSQKSKYPKHLPGKAIRFLCNYWIVVVLFSVLGLFSGQAETVPGSWLKFAGNMLVVGMSYNGAWWFVSTYLILLMLSPAFAALTKRINGIVLLAISLIVYFVAYIFRFKFVITLPNPGLQWLWRQTILLGTSQFGYFMGMVCRKYSVISRLREYLSGRRALRCGIVITLPLAAFVGHCVIQSVFVAPFTAAAAMIALFLAKLPSWAEKTFLLLGRHSTNFWLVHMFFFSQLFPNLVFSAKFPVLVFAFMMVLCFAASMVVNALYQPILARLDRR